MNDDELERQWRAHSAELPSTRLDESIRASARRAMRRRPAWQRYVPLAAAASVGVIAFLLVRQTPNPAPAPDVPVAREARESSPAPVSAAPSAPVAAEGLAKRSRVVTQERERQAAMAAQGPAEAPAHEEAPARAKALARTEASVQPDARSLADAPTLAAAARAAPSSPSGTEAVTDQAIDGLPSQIESLVKADAARRMGIEPEEVTIVAVEAVTWADGALGCRRPGELAIQVLTPGYRVDVDAAGKRLVYHTDMRAQIRVCERLSTPDAP